MDVFDLVAKLSLDQSEYESGLTDAKSKANGFGNGLKTAMGVGATAVTAVATAVVGVTSAFSNGISAVADYTDHIDKQSQKMNLSTEAYQEWSAVMEHCGTSIDSMQSSMKTLSNAVENGNEAFETLGFSMEEVQNMDNETLFSETITALQNVDDESQRTYLASQLLGRGATELGALLNQTAEETQDMKDRVKELGGVMSEDAIKAGASFKDSLQDMQTAFTGLKNNMLVEFLPAVTTVMDGLTEIFAGDSSEGIGLITDGIEEFIDNLSDLIPEVSEVGGSILSSLAEALITNLDSILTAGANVMTQLASAILNNLPTIFSTASEIVGQIVEGIITNLPNLVSTGLEIIVNLANGLAESMPDLIPTVVSVVLQITETLIDNLPTLISAGVALLEGILEGIIQSIPMIVEEIPTLVDTIIDTLVEAMPILQEGATTMFLAIIDALPEIIEALADALPEVIDSIAEFLTGGGLETIATSSLKMFLAIVNALPQILSDLLSAIGDLIVNAGVALMDYQGDILSYALEMFNGLVEGLEQTASKVIDSIKSKITEWVNAIKGKVSDFKTVGGNLITGLWNGISDKAQWVYNQITSMGQTIVDKVKGIFGVSSPSKVFAEIGGYLAEGLGIGWDEEIEDVNNSIEKDLKYKGDIDITTKTSEVTAPITKASTTDESFANMRLVLNNTTVVDGEVIEEKSYTYMINRMGEELTATKIAEGGGY